MARIPEVHCEVLQWMTGLSLQQPPLHGDRVVAVRRFLMSAGDESLAGFTQELQKVTLEFTLQLFLSHLRITQKPAEQTNGGVTGEVCKCEIL